MRSLNNEIISGLVSNLGKGDISALSKLISIVENQEEWREYIASQLYPIKSIPLCLGVTGVPGVGKSTFINKLVRFYKQNFKKIAVLAFDPSSKFSGGAFLGDRERMRDHDNDSEIYIRSIAARGKLGGLSEAVFDYLLLFASAEFELVILESVGTGQNEIDVYDFCDINIVMLSPEYGDEIQLLKAGILEIADVYVINKIYTPNTERFKSWLAGLMNTRYHKKIPIFETDAKTGYGIELVGKNVLEIYQSFKKEDIIETKHLFRLQEFIKQLVQRKLLQKLNGELDKKNITPGNLHENPYDIVNKILNTKGMVDDL